MRDTEKAEETVVGRITLGLVAMLGIKVVGIVAMVFVERLPAEALTQGVFPTMMGLVGMTTGFALSNKR